MELQLYFDILKRRIFVIMIVALVAISVVTLAGFFIPPIYRAKVTLRVLLDVGVADLTLREDYSKRLMNTYTHVLKSGPILKEAIAKVGNLGDLTSSELWEHVEVEVIPDTELITVAVENGDPKLARDLANTLGELLIEYAQNIFVGSSKSSRSIIEDQLMEVYDQIELDRRELLALIERSAPTTDIESLQSKIAFEEDSYDRLLDRYELMRLNEALRANSVAVISPATTPTDPSNSIGLMEIGISMVVGAFGGIGVALVLENLDTRIHSAQQLGRLTNVPVLGVVPSGILAPDTFDYLKSDSEAYTSPLAEAYRLLNVNLPAVQGIMSPQTILITSATSREGKSTLALNLAQTLTDRGHTVFLLETDLRHPTLSKKLGLPDPDHAETGLSLLLTQRPMLDQESLNQVIQPTPLPNLYFIGDGPKVPNPTALLASPYMEELLAYLVAQGHTTILDAPPVLGMADVSVLAPKVECAIMVVRQSYTKREQLLAALRQLRASHVNVIGLVFMQKGQKGWQYD
ncbi:MAG: hypothetical protein JXA21_03370 [Anaerolineae bacterium]|nr:hypothetical protein [Anaerolineae bacterium]